MKYKDIKTFTQRCEEHPDHQTGMITYSMIEQRLHEEIDELREYIEQREWVGLTDEEVEEIERWVEFKEEGSGRIPTAKLVRYIETKLKEKTRTWVGLSTDEFKFIASKYLLSREAGLEYFQEEIEAKLKEKNT